MKKSSRSRAAKALGPAFSLALSIGQGAIPGPASASDAEPVAVDAKSVVPDQYELSAEDSRKAIALLRQKQLIFPIQGVDPESIKGSFSEIRGNALHHASDIVAERNTPVLAVGEGKIARLWLSKAGGNTIYEIDPTGKFAYYYAHLERYAANLKEGDAVKKGQIIGFVGTSGNAPPDCPHLHFSISQLVQHGVWWPGAAVDPYEVFKGTPIASTKMSPQNP